MFSLKWPHTFEPFRFLLISTHPLFRRMFLFPSSLSDRFQRKTSLNGNVISRSFSHKTSQSKECAHELQTNCKNVVIDEPKPNYIANFQCFFVRSHHLPFLRWNRLRRIHRVHIAHPFFRIDCINSIRYRREKQDSLCVLISVYFKCFIRILIEYFVMVSPWCVDSNIERNFFSQVLLKSV